MRSTGTDRPAIAPMAGNSTEQRGRIKSPPFEFNGDRRKYVTTAKPLSIPKPLVCQGFEAPKANADSVGWEKERIEGFETNLNHQSVSDLEPDVARKHCSGGHEGGGRSEKDWSEHILGVPTVGHIPSVRFQFERISVPSHLRHAD